MRKIYYAILIVLSLLFTGCVQSVNTQSACNFPGESVSAVNSVTKHSLPTNSNKNTNTGIENSRPSGNNGGSNSSNNKLCKKSLKSSSDSPALSSLNQEPVTEDKQQGISTQNKIDHALELCQSAQDLWEKGELENALSKLDSAYSTILSLDINNHPEFNQQKEDMRYMISKRILEIYASRNIVVNGKYNEIPLTTNKYVKQQIAQLTGPDRSFFIQSLRRSGRYRPYIVSELKKAGLPVELSWLPLIESGFKIRALSKSRALGLWQFIPSTGYKFGLNRNYYIDERLDPVKSTKAAIEYFKELHKIFGDWSTVLAAYNCGEGRVLRIIRQQNINYLDNFWDLFQKLPMETAMYVPRFLAVLHIMKDPAKYNIDINDELKPVKYKIFTIKKQLRLKDIAKEIGCNYKLLKDLNPELRYALLPPDEYKLRIPQSKADTFLAKLDEIKLSYHPPARYVYHRVRKGESLSCIARKFHTTIRSIALLNGISRQNLISRGKVLKIASTSYHGSISSTSGSKRITQKKSFKYVVKRGDNLWLIAKRYSSTTKRIMAVNNLAGSSLHINQILIIPSRKSYTQGINATTYSVKSGDTPFTIAKKYNMRLNRLLSLNHLTKRSTIYPGQRLLVE